MRGGYCGWAVRFNRSEHLRCRLRCRTSTLRCRTSTRAPVSGTCAAPAPRHLRAGTRTTARGPKCRTRIARGAGRVQAQQVPERPGAWYSARRDDRGGRWGRGCGTMGRWDDGGTMVPDTDSRTPTRRLAGPCGRGCESEVEPGLDGERDGGGEARPHALEVSFRSRSARPGDRPRVPRHRVSTVKRLEHPFAKSPGKLSVRFRSLSRLSPSRSGSWRRWMS